MQPWLDVAEGGWTSVVVTNDDQAAKGVVVLSDTGDTVFGGAAAIEHGELHHRLGRSLSDLRVFGDGNLPQAEAR